jgi:hypothetical protein
MKRIIIAFLALFLVVPMVAQDYHAFLSKNSINRGFKGYSEIGFHLFNAWRDGDTPGFFPANEVLLVYGYQMGPSFYSGIGSGLSLFYTKNVLHCGDVGNITLVFPVFANFKINFLNTNLSPFLSLKTGYLFAVPGWGVSTGGDMSGGFNEFASRSGFVNPSIGIDYSVSDNFKVSFAFGINLNTITYTDSYQHW